jgi:murein DD-endopeptidase MepM/ murein hydrolase activator NlpD
MAKTKPRVVSSPLTTAFNNIIGINRSGSTMRSTQSSYQGFVNFMSSGVKSIEATKLPKKKDVKKLANLNVAATFGSAGSLLSSLVSGALDVAGLVGNFFGPKGAGSAASRSPRPIPKGKGIRLGGMKAIGIANAAFAGLDFATGLAEGESVGKAAAGAGGALAGSLIGGAIGQALIPIPGVGFVLGSMAGNFAGGYLGDRAHEAATGTGSKQQDLKNKQQERLKQQEALQKRGALASGLTMGSVLDKFEGVVAKFERANPGAPGSGTQDSASSSVENPYNEPAQYPDIEETPEGGGYNGPVSGDTFFPLPGGKSGEAANQQYGANRDGGKRKHAGLDMTHHSGALNAAVAAHKTGKVTAAVHNGYNGFVTIDHGGGLKTRYYHTTPSVKVGDTVYGGQKIANLYPDGQNTHLHYEVYKGGSPINPSSAGLGQKLPTPLDAAKAKEQSEKSSGKSSVATAPGTTPPTPSPATPSPGTTPPATAAKPTPTKQELSGMSTTQLKGMLDPIKTGASNPSVFAASQEARTKGQESGLTGEDLERAVMIASIQAKNAEPQVAPAQTQPSTQQLQQYPTYNQQQSTSSTTIVPMMMGSGGQQRPQVISVPGAPGETIVLPGPSSGALVNSLFKTMLLTNLSGS